MRLVVFRGPTGFRQEQYAHWWAAHRLPLGATAIAIDGSTVAATNEIIDLLQERMQPDEPALLVIHQAQSLQQQLAVRQIHLALRQFPHLLVALLAHYPSDVEIELLIDSQVHTTLIQAAELIPPGTSDPTGVQLWPGLARVVSLASDSTTGFDWQLVESFTRRILNQFPSEDRAALASLALPHHLTPELERALVPDADLRQRLHGYLDSGIATRDGQLPHVLRRSLLSWLYDNDLELLRSQARTYLNKCLACEDCAAGLESLAVLAEPEETTKFLVKRWRTIVAVNPELAFTLLRHRPALDSDPLLDEVGRRLCAAKHVEPTDIPLGAKEIFLGEAEEPARLLMGEPIDFTRLAPEDVMTLQWALAEMAAEDYGAAFDAAMSCYADDVSAVGKLQILTLAACAAAIAGHARRALETVALMEELLGAHRVLKKIFNLSPAVNVIRRFALVDMLAEEIPPSTLPKNPWDLPGGWMLVALEAFTEAKRQMYQGQVSAARETALELQQELNQRYGSDHVGTDFANMVLSLVSLLSANMDQHWEWLLPAANLGLERRSIQAIRSLISGDPEGAARITQESSLTSAGNIRFEVHRLFVLALAQEENGDLKGAATAMQAALTLHEESGLAFEFAFLPTDFANKMATRVPALGKLRSRIVNPNWAVPEISLTRRLGLTGAEMEVLALLASPNTLTQIANLRFTSVNTVRSQVRAIYRKLDATSRQAAVSKAAGLGIIRSSSVFHPFLP